MLITQSLCFFESNGVTPESVHRNLGGESMAWATSLSSSYCRHVLISTSLSSPASTLRSRLHCPLQPGAIPCTRNLASTCKFRVHSSRRTNNASDESTAIGSSSSSKSTVGIDCIGTGIDVECIVNPNQVFDDEKLERVEGERYEEEELGSGLGLVGDLWEWAVLISPFFFWGTAMVAMKEVLPKVGPFFVAGFRLIPAGLLLIGFARSKGRPLPSGFNAWLAISLFAFVDASCFQGFLAEGLQRTSAGLGSVIIDSQPLTVAILAALFFGESIGYVGAAGLVLGIVGLSLLELPAIAIDGNDFSLWGSGEWWMLLAAQSMAIGTVMVRPVSKYADPVMATGWHMVLGGLPLVALSVLNNEPALNGSLSQLSATDISALLYTSIFGSAVSYGVFFYNATRGSLTKLSSLTFMTPVFASIFGFLYLGESFSNVQLAGAFITLVAIYLVNYSSNTEG